jgi:hypothetical protein
MWSLLQNISRTRKQNATNLQNIIKIQCDNGKKTNNCNVKREERRGKGGKVKSVRTKKVVKRMKRKMGCEKK